MKNFRNSITFKILITFIFIYAIAFAYRYIKYKEVKIINSDKLELITYYGDNNAYHPKVLYFENGWNGYKYWMSFTPYTHANSDVENPSINVSNDMINWLVPNDLTNPIDEPDNADVVHYYSDSHLVYNDEKDQLEIFWRYVNDEDNEATIYISTSTDGINWSEKEIFLKSNDRKAQDYVSPSIIYEDGIYRVWYVHRKQIWYMEMNESYEIVKEPVMLKINYADTHYTWHIDVVETNGVYEIVAVSYVNVNDRTKMEIYYFSSEDNKTWTTPKLIISPSNVSNRWDNQGLYRPSILHINNKYYIFYSGHDKDYNVGIGLMCGKNINDLKSCTNLEDIN